MRDTEFAEFLDEVVIQFLGLSGRRRIRIVGAVPFLGAAGERELRDDEDLTANIEDPF